MNVQVFISLYVLQRKIENVMCCEGIKREKKKKKWPFTGKCLNTVCQNIKYI